MTIGIIGAMDEEIALFLDVMTNKRELTVANTLFVEGKIAGTPVVLLKSGIGKVNAALSTTIMHERFSPHYVINTGTAGGFDASLDIGDLVISSAVVHHDVDVTVFNYDYGQVPGMPATYKADPYLIDQTMIAAKEADLPFKKGLIATGDSFMDDADRVKDVKTKFPNMIAGEMEAAAVAQVCHHYGKPFVIIRALSDIAGKESSVSFNEFIHQAAKHATQLVVKTIKRLEQ